MDLIGFLDFHFSKKPEDDHITYIYMTETWQGEPVESEEMKPAFFLPEEIPYDHMWQGDRIWLPRLLQGEKVKGQAYGAIQFINEERPYPKGKASLS